MNASKTSIKMNNLNFQTRKTIKGNRKLNFFSMRLIYGALSKIFCNFNLRILIII